MEPVLIVNADGTTRLTPELIYNEFLVKSDYVDKRLGITIPIDN